MKRDDCIGVIYRLYRDGYIRGNISRPYPMSPKLTTVSSITPFAVALDGRSDCQGHSLGGFVLGSSGLSRSGALYFRQARNPVAGALLFRCCSCPC